MPTPEQIQQAISEVNDQESFIQRLLVQTLDWPIPEIVTDVEDMAVEWTDDELNTDGLSQTALAGPVLQLQPITPDQPWGIFILEFANEDVFTKSRGLTGPLRKVLRGLAPKRRGRPAHLPAWERDNLLFICTHQYQHFRFAYFEKPAEDHAIPKLVTFGWSPDIPVRTACEFNLPHLIWPQNPDDSESWVQVWQHAFDKQKLTQAFFNEYKAIFDIFRKDVEKQIKNLAWAHDYCLQFLNRCMFLFFIQRKGWIGYDTSFLKSFWQIYRQHKKGEQTFVQDWLNVLFFKAFNNKFHGGYTYFPPELKKILQTAPYLNGGLFNKNKLDEEYDILIITDDRFEQILNFLDRYNFTVSEDTPLDIEVAVDAEMLGNVYESLVNISEDEDRRGDAGIFYTPKAEVDLMCRLSLVNYLCSNLGQEHREIFYKWLFAISSEQKNIAASAIKEKRLEESLESTLKNLTVLDPACGSGAFLVGMLSVLDELTQRLNRQKKRKPNTYDRRKQIIGQSLYGVDVKEWACHVAELRLWLALIIDAQFSLEELTIRKEPLLPNFTFNIRCGDSLIQEVGGLDLAHRRGTKELSRDMKAKLNELKKEKAAFYNNASTANYKSADELHLLEVRVFHQLLQDRISQIDKKVRELMRIQEETKPVQQRSLLTGELEGPTKQYTFEHLEREGQIQALMEEKDRLGKLADVLHDKTNIRLIRLMRRLSCAD